eukprot:90177_1
MCAEYRNRYPRKMGGINRPVTSDMTYVGAKNAKGTNDNIKEHKETNVYSICEITFNEKRRHTQRSLIARTESIDNVGGFIDYEVYRDSPYWQDGCGISHSVFMEETGGQWLHIGRTATNNSAAHTFPFLSVFPHDTP